MEDLLALVKGCSADSDSRDADSSGPGGRALLLPARISPPLLSLARRFNPF